MAKIVHCVGCHAELFDDRKNCPHCSAEIVSEESAREKLMAENLRLNMELNAATSDLAKENEALAAKLAALHASKAAPFAESAE
jgi:hypothetical protein